MNPLAIWASMKPAVKMTIVICITVILVASMGFGYFEAIVGLFAKG